MKDEDIKIQCIDCNYWSQFPKPTHENSVFPTSNKDTCQSCGSKKFDWRSSISVRTFNTRGEKRNTQKYKRR